MGACSVWSMNRFMERSSTRGYRDLRAASCLLVDVAFHSRWEDSMGSTTCHGLSFFMVGLLEHLSGRVPLGGAAWGRVAVIGSNAAGKSTVIKARSPNGSGSVQSWLVHLVGAPVKISFSMAFWPSGRCFFCISTINRKIDIGRLFDWDMICWQSHAIESETDQNYPKDSLYLPL